MTVLIGGIEYEAVTTAVTALRFRARYNKSCMADDFSDEDGFNLLYTSIEDGNKPCYRDFMDMCRNDKYAFRMAFSVYKDILRKDKTSLKPTDTGKTGSDIKGYSEFDEFHMMAAFSASGLPQFLWHELSLMQILSVTSITCDFKNGREKPKELTYEETAQMYCIDEAAESKIQEYLDAHPELIAGEEEN